MRNDRLKPAYNVQIAVNSEYITGIDAFSNRTDYGMLERFLDTMAEKHERKYEKVTTDAGYESLDNYLYLEENGQISFNKPQNYEQTKTKKYKAQIGRAENMQYDAEADCYICAEGRRLPLIRECVNEYSKRESFINHYRSSHPPPLAPPRRRCKRPPVPGSRPAYARRSSLGARCPSS